jgi:RNA polymerase sigma factor (sigma-70 family)
MTNSPLDLLRQLRAPETRPEAELLDRVARRHDPDALQALVARHGALVYGVCQRLLRCRADVEDVFQATFLVLLRRPPVLRPGGSLAGWLHTVAYRLALRALAAARRQQPLASEPGQPGGREPLDEISGRELCAVIDEELQRLPERYRAPIQLCCLGGRSREEAARELGWAEGSVKARLQRGRELLRRRLARRGLTLGAVFLPQLLGPVPVPAALLSAAWRLPAGRSASPGAVRLAEAALAGLPAAPARSSAVLALLLALVTVGAGLAWARARQPTNLPPPAAPDAPASSTEEKTAVSGQKLPEGAVAQLGSVRFWHAGFSAPITFSANGKTLVTRGGDDDLRTWEVATGREISSRKVPGLGGAVCSPDGRFRAANVGRGRDSRVVVTDIRTGKTVLKLPAAWDGRLPQFTRDGKLLLVQVWDGRTVEGQTGDNRVEIWDVEAARKRAALKVPITPDPPVLSEDGTLLACVHRDVQAERQEVAVFAVPAGKILFSLTNLPPVSRVGFSPDGRFLLSAHGYATPGQPDALPGVLVWDARTGRRLYQFQPGLGLCLGFAVSPDSRLLVVAQEGTSPNSPRVNGTLRVYELTTGKEIRAIPGRPVTHGPMLFSPDARLLAVGTRGGPVRLYEVATGKEVGAAEGHAAAVTWCGFSPDGRTLATRGADHTLRLWEPRRGRLLAAVPVAREVHEEFSPSGSAVFSADGKRLALVTDDSFFRVFDAATLKELTSWSAGAGLFQPVPLAFRPDGKVLAAPHQYPRVWLWDLATKECVGRVGDRVNGCVHGVAFLPSGRRFITLSSIPDPSAGHAAWVELWNPHSGKAVWSVPSQVRHPRALALSRNGRLAAAGGADGGLEVYEVATGELLFSRQGPRGQPLTAIGFSPDCRLVVSAAGRELSVYDLAAGRELLRRRGHGAEISALSVAPDGSSVATASADTTVLLWRMPRPAAAAPVKLGQQELESCWKRLAEPSPGAETLAVVRRLAGAGGQALALLRERLGRPTGTAPDWVAGRIAALESRSFAARRRAFEDLRALGVWAEAPLRRALEKRPTLETRRQIESLLNLLAKETTEPRGEVLRARRAVWVAELIGTDEARALLRAWVDRPPSLWLLREAQEALRRPGR